MPGVRFPVTEFFGVLAQSEACVLRKHEVLGSKPRYSNRDATGVLAQSEACVLSKDEVLGSKPRYSIFGFAAVGMV